MRPLERSLGREAIPPPAFSTRTQALRVRQLARQVARAWKQLEELRLEDYRRPQDYRRVHTLRRLELRRRERLLQAAAARLGSEPPGRGAPLAGELPPQGRANRCWR